jgi:transposase
LASTFKRRMITDLTGIFKVSRRAIERWLDKWEKERLNSSSKVAGRGVQASLKGLEQEVSVLDEANSRNLKSLLLELKEKCKIRICKKILQNFLKGTKLHLEENVVITKHAC